MCKNKTVFKKCETQSNSIGQHPRLNDRECKTTTASTTGLDSIVMFSVSVQRALLLARSPGEFSCAQGQSVCPFPTERCWRAAAPPSPPDRHGWPRHRPRLGGLSYAVVSEPLVNVGNAPWLHRRLSDDTALPSETEAKQNLFCPRLCPKSRVSGNHSHGKAFSSGQTPIRRFKKSRVSSRDATKTQKPRTNASLSFGTSTRARSKTRGGPSRSPRQG